MKANYKLALTLLTGAALGAAAIQGLHAQAKPPSYVVFDFSEITDPTGFKDVAQSSPARTAAFKEFGGHYIVRTDKITALDGAAPKRFTVIAFDSPEKAQAWNNSTTQKEVNATIAKTTKSRSFIVEGM